ncbi:WxL domain-containing protein [Companilactobacillus sp.]|jgi:hypothetical protein|uniref:WxL domain-containing protein n=1 Tax=Companilactobacillus sp. TaxID=2767905 RepID=UPI0025BE5840|nr:WxL domain-containing protein [Companilactobacillus sp.]MCH4008566.1 WxL domain-containing protein [Companilactobacillus sp.]MCH4051255.1 WxL domain-containing protein [Companilactobacillus sp.]MCH4076509.1 WxL domain-containing protein [Companilactobacillus sp.]MCH4125084.1 WxL domain-containing protein [Companilactobacillus sp.]MCH4131625.1 WxL domain-containing protein [Companilactobacillus sp.]
MTIMRKTLLKVTLCGAALLAAFGTAGIGTASAATETTTGSPTSTTSTLDATAGPLALQTVPTLDLGSGEINDLSSMTFTSTTADASPLTVDDPGYQGGYTVTASATPFANGKLALHSTSFNLSTTGGAFSSATGGTSDPTANSTEITDTAAPIITANTPTDADPIGIGTYKYTYGTNAATLTVEPQTILAGTYTSDVTWTLNATPIASTGTTASTTPAA